jgi:hypothetical protein
VNAAVMILDEQLPRYDVAITVHAVVAATPEVTWRAARDLDFMTIHTPLTSLAMWARELPARLRGQPLPRPASLRLSQGAGLAGWLPLGEKEGCEVAFGAVGKFWQPSITWHDVSPAGFADFAEPGYGKIGCNFTVRPYGAGRTLLSYECRVATTDSLSRRRFARYWMLIRPFVAHIMRAATAAIAASAERQGTAAPQAAASARHG